MTYFHYSSEANTDSFVKIPTYEKLPMSIPDDVYRELAEKVRIEANYSYKEYAKVNVEAERDDKVYRLSITAFFYYEKIEAPDAIWHECSGIATVWHEFHAYDEAGVERPNDFDYNIIKSLIHRLV